MQLSEVGHSVMEEQVFRQSKSSRRMLVGGTVICLILSIWNAYEGIISNEWNQIAMYALPMLVMAAIFAVGSWRYSVIVMQDGFTKKAIRSTFMSFRDVSMVDLRDDMTGVSNGQRTIWITRSLADWEAVTKLVLSRINLRNVEVKGSPSLRRRFDLS